MKNRVLSLLISAVMLVTVFSIPFTAVADTTAATSDTENSETLIEEEQNGEGEQTGENENNEPQIIEPVDISEALVTLAKTSYAYTGSPIIPKVTVQLGETVLVEDQDYTVEVTDNTDLGTATIIITGLDPYQGSIEKTFTITKANISKAAIKTKYSNYAFSKKAVKPAVTVTLGGKKLVLGRDYSASYKNNVYPGTATITIKGKGCYTGTATKNFYIAKVSGLKVKARGTNYLTLGWSKTSYVTGYKLYTYNFSKKKWKLIKTIKGNYNTSYKIKNLGPGYGYKYRVRTYYKKGLKTYYGATTEMLTPTRPAKCKITSISQDALLKMTVKWKATRGTGYQVRVATNSKFSKATVYTIKGSSLNSKMIDKLVDQRTYYVQVRAYRTYGNQTAYGSWSSAYKTKASDTGWVYKGGYRYYYINSVPFKGTKTISDKRYYFDTKTGIMRGASSTMWSKVKNQTSKTKYLIAVSRDMNRVMVYSGKVGDWKPLYYWKCTDGASGTRTPIGSYLTPTDTPKKRYIGGHITYTCWYATRIHKHIYFHSVLYYPRSKTNIQDGRLGISASHGCIRLSLTNAKWLYDNIKPGTRVVIY